MKKLFSLVMAFTAATTMAFAVGTANVTTDCGKTVRLSVTPKEGYEFVEWQNGAGVTVSTANPYDVVASADATYTAILQLKTYTISYAKGTNPGVTVTLLPTPRPTSPLLLCVTPALTFWQVTIRTVGVRTRTVPATTML